MIAPVVGWALPTIHHIPNFVTVGSAPLPVFNKIERESAAIPISTPDGARQRLLRIFELCT
jgi:hypothetical protein